MNSSSLARQETAQQYWLIAVMIGIAQYQSRLIPFPRLFPGNQPVDLDCGGACGWAIRRRCSLGARRISAGYVSALPGCRYQLPSPRIPPYLSKNIQIPIN
jgi:hypothetical protein